MACAAAPLCPCCRRCVLHRAPRKHMHNLLACRTCPPCPTYHSGCRRRCQSRTAKLQEAEDRTLGRGWLHSFSTPPAHTGIVNRRVGALIRPSIGCTAGHSISTLCTCHAYQYENTVQHTRLGHWPFLFHLFNGFLQDILLPLKNLLALLQQLLARLYSATSRSGELQRGTHHAGTPTGHGYTL